MRAKLPPQYVNISSAVVYLSDLPESVLVTLIRLKGLAWQDKEKRVLPEMTQEELCEIIRRGWRTLYGHLGLLRDKGFLSFSSQGSVFRITLSDPPLQNSAMLNVVVEESDSQDSEGSIQQQQQDSDSRASLQKIATTADPLQKIAMNGDMLQKIAMAGESELPADVLTQLKIFGWVGNKQVVVQAYANDPKRVIAWLSYIRRQTSIEKPSAFLQTALKSDDYPPAEPEGLDTSKSNSSAKYSGGAYSDFINQFDEDDETDSEISDAQESL